MATGAALTLVGFAILAALWWQFSSTFDTGDTLTATPAAPPPSALEWGLAAYVAAFTTLTAGPLLLAYGLTTRKRHP